MSDFDLIVKLLSATLLGALYGLERESKNFKFSRIGGVRTFSIIAILGFLVGLTAYKGFELISLAFIVVFCALIIAEFILFRNAKKPGVTTEVGALIIFLISIMLGAGLFKEYVLLSIGLFAIYITSIKEVIMNISLKINRTEVLDLVKFSIISLVILPLLPNDSLKLNKFPEIISITQQLGINPATMINVDLINPFRIWLIVSLILGLNLFGSLLSKFITSKGAQVLPYIISGFVSSTSTTKVLASQSSKGSGKITTYLASISILTNAVSIVRILFLLLSISILLFREFLYPALSIIFIGVIISYYLYSISEESSKIIKSSREDSRFNLKPVLKFAALLVSIEIIVNSSLVLLGEGAFFAAIILGAIIGMDAVVISIAELIVLDQISTNTGLLALLFANFTNLVVSKGFITYKWGSGEYFKLSIIGFLAMGVIGFMFII